MATSADGQFWAVPAEVRSSTEAVEAADAADAPDAADVADGTSPGVMRPPHAPESADAPDAADVDGTSPRVMRPPHAPESGREPHIHHPVQSTSPQRHADAPGNRYLGELFLRVERCRDLPLLTSGRKPNPYFEVVVQGEKRRSQNVEQGTQDPRWNEKFTFTGLPSRRVDVGICLFSEPPPGSQEGPEILGTCHFPVGGCGDRDGGAEWVRVQRGRNKGKAKLGVRWRFSWRLLDECSLRLCIRNGLGIDIPKAVVKIVSAEGRILQSTRAAEEGGSAHGGQLTRWPYSGSGNLDGCQSSLPKGGGGKDRKGRGMDLPRAAGGGCKRQRGEPLWWYTTEMELARSGQVYLSVWSADLWNRPYRDFDSSSFSSRMETDGGAPMAPCVGEITLDFNSRSNRMDTAGEGFISLTRPGIGELAALCAETLYLRSAAQDAAAASCGVFRDTVQLLSMETLGKTQRRRKRDQVRTCFLLAKVAESARRRVSDALCHVLKRVADYDKADGLGQVKETLPVWVAELAAHFTLTPKAAGYGGAQAAEHIPGLSPPRERSPSATRNTNHYEGLIKTLRCGIMSLMDMLRPWMDEKNAEDYRRPTLAQGIALNRLRALLKEVHRKGWGDGWEGGCGEMGPVRMFNRVWRLARAVLLDPHAVGMLKGHDDRVVLIERFVDMPSAAEQVAELMPLLARLFALDDGAPSVASLLLCDSRGLPLEPSELDPPLQTGEDLRLTVLLRCGGGGVAQMDSKTRVRVRLVRHKVAPATDDAEPEGGDERDWEVVWERVVVSCRGIAGRPRGEDGEAVHPWPAAGWDASAANFSLNPVFDVAGWYFVSATVEQDCVAPPHTQFLRNATDPLDPKPPDPEPVLASTGWFIVHPVPDEVLFLSPPVSCYVGEPLLSVEGHPLEVELVDKGGALCPLDCTVTASLGGESESITVQMSGGRARLEGLIVQEGEVEEEKRCVHVTVWRGEHPYLTRRGASFSVHTRARRLKIVLADRYGDTQSPIRSGCPFECLVKVVDEHARTAPLDAAAFVQLSARGEDAALCGTTVALLDDEGMAHFPAVVATAASSLTIEATLVPEPPYSLAEPPPVWKLSEWRQGWVVEWDKKPPPSSLRSLDTFDLDFTIAPRGASGKKNEAAEGLPPPSTLISIAVVRREGASDEQGLARNVQVLVPGVGAFAGEAKVRLDQVWSGRSDWRKKQAGCTMRGLRLWCGSVDDEAQDLDLRVSVTTTATATAATHNIKLLPPLLERVPVVSIAEPTTTKLIELSPPPPAMIAQLGKAELLESAVTGLSLQVQDATGKAVALPGCRLTLTFQASSTDSAPVPTDAGQLLCVTDEAGTAVVKRIDFSASGAPERVRLQVTMQVEPDQDKMPPCMPCVFDVSVPPKRHQPEPFRSTSPLVVSSSPGTLPATTSGSVYLQISAQLGDQTRIPCVVELVPFDTQRAPLSSEVWRIDGELEGRGGFLQVCKDGTDRVWYSNSKPLRIVQSGKYFASVRVQGFGPARSGPIVVVPGPLHRAKITIQASDDVQPQSPSSTALPYNQNVSSPGARHFAIYTRPRPPDSFSPSSPPPSSPVVSPRSTQPEDGAQGPVEIEGGETEKGPRCCTVLVEFADIKGNPVSVKAGSLQMRLLRRFDKDLGTPPEEVFLPGWSKFSKASCSWGLETASEDKRRGRGVFNRGGKWSYFVPPQGEWTVESVLKVFTSRWATSNPGERADERPKVSQVEFKVIGGAPGGLRIHTPETLPEGLWCPPVQIDLMDGPASSEFAAPIAAPTGIPVVACVRRADPEIEGADSLEEPAWQAEGEIRQGETSILLPSCITSRPGWRRVQPPEPATPSKWRGEVWVQTCDVHEDGTVMARGERKAADLWPGPSKDRPPLGEARHGMRLWWWEPLWRLPEGTYYVEVTGRRPDGTSLRAESSPFCVIAAPDEGVWDSSLVVRAARNAFGVALRQHAATFLRQTAEAAWTLYSKPPPTVSEGAQDSMVKARSMIERARWFADATLFASAPCGHGASLGRSLLPVFPPSPPPP
eukprot:Hpha_TRINITY_DN9705_c0_g2::TRINITY_DN9705_c0_g2_i1::g.10140::m.10140